MLESITMSDNDTTLSIMEIVGMLYTFSVMITLLKKLLRVFALSLDDVAIFLSNFSNDGIILLEVSLLAYFQKDVGLFLMLSAFHTARHGTARHGTALYFSKKIIIFLRAIACRC